MTLLETRIDRVTYALGARLAGMPYHLDRQLVLRGARGVARAARARAAHDRSRRAMLGAGELTPGTLEHFACERYRAYAQLPVGRTLCVQIGHPPWRARTVVLQEPLTPAALGLAVDVTAGLGAAVRGRGGRRRARGPARRRARGRGCIRSRVIRFSRAQHCSSASSSAWRSLPAPAGSTCKRATTASAAAATAPAASTAAASRPRRADHGGERAGAEEAQASRRRRRARPGAARAQARARRRSRRHHRRLARTRRARRSHAGRRRRRELQQEDLDAVFRPAQSAISRCITDAVGDYPLESGKIEVAFRVERTGAVRKVRITAPQLLMRRGFTACVRPIVTGLHFPASGGANVVTYPFSLQ